MTGSTEPVLRAAKIVGAAQGIEVRAHPGAAEDPSTEDMTYGERVNTIAIASNFRMRTVALREDWWERRTRARCSARLRRPSSRSR